MTTEEMVTIGEIYLKAEPGSGSMVVLKENAEADHYFMMFVGDAEFAAIAREKGMIAPKRPLTYELYMSIMDHLAVEFQRVEITHMREDTYYAVVHFLADGSEHSADSRPSDAVALALNRKAPIMVSRSLFRRELTQEEVKEYEGIVKKVKF
jgi:bifunctional DNase/RNase